MFETLSTYFIQVTNLWLSKYCKIDGRSDINEIKFNYFY